MVEDQVRFLTVIILASIFWASICIAKLEEFGENNALRFRPLKPKPSLVSAASCRSDKNHITVAFRQMLSTRYHLHFSFVLKICTILKYFLKVLF